MPLDGKTRSNPTEVADMQSNLVASRCKHGQECFLKNTRRVSSLCSFSNIEISPSVDSETHDYLFFPGVFCPSQPEKSRLRLKRARLIIVSSSVELIFFFFRVFRPVAME